MSTIDPTLAAGVALQCARASVRTLMTREVVVLDARQPLRDAMQVFATEPLDHLLVTDGARLAGVVSALAVLENLVADADSQHAMISTAMDPPVLIHPDAPISEAIHALVTRHASVLVVIDGEAMHGTFTLADVVRALHPIQHWARLYATEVDGSIPFLH